MSDGPLPAVAPIPPRAGGRLPRVGAGLHLLRDPARFFERRRRRLGDTFLVDAFGYRLLCVFSPEGVRNLWALPEKEASKGVADFFLLRHKVPDELFAGRRTRPHDLFAKDDVAVYLHHVREAVDLELEALGSAGRLELFAFTRRLGHRVGLASWGGVSAHDARHLDRLVPALDRLDIAESFVHPHRGLWTKATGKRAERRALAELDAVYREILASRGPVAPDSSDLFDRIRAAWDGVASPEREAGVARDVVLVHLGSMSNLFAAMAWTLVHLLERPDLAERVRAGDDALLERCAHESIRLRQRSIVLRRVLQPLSFSDGKAAFRVEPGVFLATTLAVTNVSAAPGLDRFDPGNFDGRRFVRAEELPARELVATFGHGRHACPAQGFSIAAIAHSARELLRRFELTPRFRGPQPLRRQLGGVARADRRCRVDYRRR